MRTPPRTAQILLCAAAAAVSATWALRAHTGPTPSPMARAHALAYTGHHQNAVVLAPPVVEDAVANTAGLLALSLVPMVLGITVAARLGGDRWPAFAGFAGLAAAAVTLAVAATALGGAVSLTGSLASAATVLRDTVVVAVVVCAVAGVPWRSSPSSNPAKV
ncbi:hypothetical protein SAMN05192558_104430 [Actinokineospora alba]|uniref:DUF998 domain-containing protein n=1 Tax=Actinokineospora alba TaxID=504798 RepID=A0A1H0M6L4_9PSEU|nr:hypothetical protein [Actinokineospora alba]TDP67601.1 hypothetical protein C8E96_3147 [Actinokineospora alba]SDI44706.1 hypothetical protein SAMN05421871_10530 [Actinokineospora alba]SDO75921.1 hypothetical protein SAMN05192558_104430 [Actinokineospora alba]